jgi:hypothetical protein
VNGRIPAIWERGRWYINPADLPQIAVAFGMTPNGRCRLHGGLSTGPRTPEGLAQIRAARTTHGMRTDEMEELRALVRELRAGAKRLVEMT